MLHPVYKKLLWDFCSAAGLDHRVVRKMIRGRLAPSPVVVRAFEEVGVPATAWSWAPPEAVVSSPPSGHNGEVNATQRAVPGDGVKRRKRRLTTEVHEVLDRLEWTIGDLAAAVARELGRPVSRASMQFWATGQRQVKRSKEDKRSDTRPVQAPADVKRAALAVTRRQAAAAGKGAAAVLRPESWPNVEPEA